MLLLQMHLGRSSSKDNFNVNINVTELTCNLLSRKRSSKIKKSVGNKMKLLVPDGTLLYYGFTIPLDGVNRK